MKSSFLLLLLATTFYLCQARHRLHFWKKEEPKTFGAYNRLGTDSKGQYYGDFSIGSSGESYKLVIDTTMGDLAVLSTDCKVTLCRGHNLYQYKAGKTTGHVNITNHQVPYTTTDDTLNDIMNVPTEILQLQITDEKEDFLSKDTLYDGFFGINLRSATSKEPLLTRLDLSNPLIGMHFTDGDGEVIFGGYNEDIVDKFAISYIPVIKGESAWNLRVTYIEGVGSGFKSWCMFGCTANLDSTVQGIIGPQDEIDRLHKYIKASTFGKERTVDCNSIDDLPKLSFHIHGEEFTLEGKDYIYKKKVYGSVKCVSAFTTHDRNHKSTHWTLGQVFFKKYYVIFNFLNPTAAKIAFVNTQKRSIFDV